MRRVTRILVQRPRSHVLGSLFMALALQCQPAGAGEPYVEMVALPPLLVEGQPARAHTQGLEWINGDYHVTARRDDVRPRRALLLRTSPGRPGWDVWDITPTTDAGTGSILDHPGGFQSDGKRLWIPLAESRRNGSTIIRAYPLENLVPNRRLDPGFEFAVNDHIGALAVDAKREQVVGASWDTETVYIWGFDGQLERTLKGAALTARGLGVSAEAPDRSGIAVQDWKIGGSRLFASGLFRGPEADDVDAKSRLAVFSRFTDHEFEKHLIILPKPNGVELANEGMVVADGVAHFLPQDLGATNRVFRFPLPE